MAEPGQPMLDEAVGQLLQLYLRIQWDPSIPEAGRALVDRSDVNWDRLGQVARMEGLAPLLYHIVQGRNLVAPAVEQGWRRVYYTNALRGERLFREF